MAYYTDLMDTDFEWDEAKSAACLRERGFDFAYAIRAFLDRERVIRADDRYDYGEPRYRLYGRIDGRLFVIVYTVRPRAIRIISARKANSREIRDHDHSKDAPDA